MPTCEICGNTEDHIYANVGSNLSCALKKIERLEKECTEKGWDTEGAEALTKEAILAARQLLSHLDSLNLVPNCIVPINSGGIDFSWSYNGDSEGISMEISSSGLDDPIGLWSPESKTLQTILSDSIQNLVKLERQKKFNREC